LIVNAFIRVESVLQSDNIVLFWAKFFKTNFAYSQYGQMFVPQKFFKLCDLCVLCVKPFWLRLRRAVKIRG